MTYAVTSRGQTRRVEIQGGAGGLQVRVDDRAFPVDVLPLGPRHYSLLLDGRCYEVDVLETEEGTVILVNGQPFRVEVRQDQAPETKAGKGKRGGGTDERVVTAPMPGKVIKLLVGPGEAVQAGDGVVVVEAMKMENELKAPAAGTVAEVRTEEGKTVNGGDVLVVIE